MHDQDKTKDQLIKDLQKEQSIETSNNNMTAIFNAMVDGVYVADDQYNIQFVNHILTNELGDYAGQKCFAYFHDRTDPCPWCKNDKVFAGETVRWELTLTKNRKTYDLIDTPLKNSDGTFSKLQIFREVTDHKIVEQALRESELKFRLLTDYSFDWEYWRDEKNRYRYTSRACERITGYSPEEFMADSHLFFRIITPEYRTMVKTHFQEENNEEHKVASMQFQIITKSGERRWIGHHCSPVFDAGGDYIGTRGINRDITERKRAQLSLEESTARLKAIYDGIPEAIVAVNLDRDIISINQKFLDLFGYSEAEIMGKKISTIYESHAEFERQGRLRYNLAADDQLAPYTVNYKTKNEYIFPGETLGVPILDAKGTKIGFLGVIRDISEKLELESQLRQAQKLEAVGVMVGGIAHDFNNILQSIFLYSEVVNSQISKDSELKKDFQHIIDAGERASKLVKQILTFCRKSDVALKVQAIHKIILEAISFEKASTPTNIEIISNIDANCRKVLCDRTQVHQIILNLCNNAKQAIGEDIGTIEISLNEVTASLESGDPETELLELTISDNGPGMAPETLERIFDPFFTTKKVGRGTGLGLSVVHGIVGTMGGKIKVSSIIGKGTTFILHIPVAKGHLERVPTMPPLKLSGDQYRILLADDEESIVTAGKVMLKQAGHRVETATDGKQALAIYHRDSDVLDIIVTDLFMPTLSGVQLAQEIRKAGGRIPIILSSGSLTTERHEEYKGKGITAFIQKPWNHFQLMQLIQTVMKTNDE